MADVLDDDSIRVEPILIDLDIDGIDLEDAEDVIQHILGRD